MTNVSREKQNYKEMGSQYSPQLRHRGPTANDHNKMLGPTSLWKLQDGHHLSCLDYSSRDIEQHDHQKKHSIAFDELRNLCRFQSAHRYHLTRHRFYSYSASATPKQAQCLIPAMRSLFLLCRLTMMIEGWILSHQLFAK
jgi:hypothetical protein